MSLIVGLGNSEIINMSVSINLNSSSNLGKIRYMNVNKRIAFMVNASDSRYVNKFEYDCEYE